jgi:hypothetical protein
MLADADAGPHGPEAWRCIDETLGRARLAWAYGWRLPRDGFESLVTDALHHCASRAPNDKRHHLMMQSAFALVS